MEKFKLEIPEGIQKISELMNMIEEVIIPNSVTEIGSFAFSWCPFKKISIPDSVTIVGVCAFMGCSNLEAIYIDKEKDSLNLKWADIPEHTKVYWRGEF